MAAPARLMYRGNAEHIAGGTEPGLQAPWHFHTAVCVRSGTPATFAAFGNMGQIYRSTAQRSAIVLAVFFQIAATALPALGIGEPIGSRSDELRTLITPAGWAFSIWGLLYLGSIVFALYQAFPAQYRNGLLDRIGWFAAAAFFGNGLWALYTQLHDLTALSVVVIATTLVCLLVILRRIVTAKRLSRGDRWLAAVPLTALAAWLTAATIVNVAASLTYHGIGEAGGYPLLSAGIVFIGGLIAALAVTRSRGCPWYAAVFLWALLAIYFQGGQQASMVAIAAAISAVLVIASTAFALRSRRNRSHWLG